MSVIILAYVAFIALGMPDGLLGIAWPTMRVDFGVPLDSLGMLLFASVTGYMTSSFLSGTLISIRLMSAVRWDARVDTALASLGSLATR